MFSNRRIPTRFVIIVLILSVLSGLTLSWHAASAQGGPTSIIDAAYADLSQKLGKPLARGGDSSYTWEEDVFGDSSLGCPQPGKTYTQAVTPGFKIVITFAGTAYDYRATKDGKVVFLCSGITGVAMTATPVVGPAFATKAPQLPATGNFGAVRLPGPLAYLDHNGNVVMVQAGLTTPVQITSDSAATDMPGVPFNQTTRNYGQFRWSPDGTKLLFTEMIQHVLFVALSGQAPIRVASGINFDYPGAWSPDGSKIAYAIATNEQRPPTGVVNQVQAVTLMGNTVSAPQYAGAFAEGMGCGGGGIFDPADMLYYRETGYNGVPKTLTWTSQGFIHTVACNGVDLALANANGQDVWTAHDITIAAVSPDGTRIAARKGAAPGLPATLVVIDANTGNLAAPPPQPDVDQVAWSADGTTIIYSTVTPGQSVKGTPQLAAGMQMFPGIWPVEVKSNTVALWKIPAAGGQPVQLNLRIGRGIGVITPAPDNSGVVFSFIPTSADMIQKINSGGSVNDALALLPRPQLLYVPMAGGAQAVTLAEGGQPALGKGPFTPAGAAVQSLPTPIPNLAPPALVVGGRAVVTTTRGDVLNVRESASRGAKVLRILKPGALVDVLSGPLPAEGLRWWQVRADDGVTGWVVDQVTDQDGTTNTLAPVG